MRTQQLLQTLAMGLVFGGSFAAGIQAQEQMGLVPYNTYSSQNLFGNAYTQGYANQANAAMYISPVPVPPDVGHTYLTYQPLYPHQMMNWHYNRFHNYYDNGRGLNRTKVEYYAPPVRTGVNYVWRKIQLPRP